MESPEKMSEPEFRKFVIERLNTYSIEHADTLAAVRRVESHTRLARDVQNISKMARVMIRVGGCISKLILKVVAGIFIFYLAIYMAFHEGHIPIWAHDALMLIRSDH